MSGQFTDKNKLIQNDNNVQLSPSSGNVEEDMGHAGRGDNIPIPPPAYIPPAGHQSGNDEGMLRPTSEREMEGNVAGHAPQPVAAQYGGPRAPRTIVVHVKQSYGTRLAVIGAIVKTNRDWLSHLLFFYIKREPVS